MNNLPKLKLWIHRLAKPKGLDAIAKPKGLKSSVVCLLL